MRLLRLRLQNFRQHAATDIEFKLGLTGIIGPNGAGKSTILEAIAWAIYGAGAARGTNETIRFSRAAPRSRVEVELTFMLAQHEFRVLRTLSSAEVFVDGSATPAATTLGGATEYLVGRLGMTREEFFNTYFTGQKELQFLAQMGPTQRARFLGQVLGYERLKIAQENARARRNGLRHEIEGLKAGLPDPEHVRADLEQAVARDAEAAAQRAAAESDAAASAAALAAAQPRWDAACAARERDRELAHAIDVAQREAESARAEAERAAAELAEIETARQQLAEQRLRMAELPSVADEAERMAQHARVAERVKAKLENQLLLIEDLRATQQRIARLEPAVSILADTVRELHELRAGLQEAEAAYEAQHESWMRDRQEVDTRLENYRQRAQELKDQIQQLEGAGPDGICPTCEQPLGRNYENVIGKLRDEWVTLVQDGKWLKQRQDQLKAKPATLDEAEQRRATAAKAVEEKAQRSARCERAIVERDELVRERDVKSQRLEKLRDEIDALPDDYDADRHRAVEDRLKELRTIELQVSRLEQTVESAPLRVRARDTAMERAEKAAAAAAASLEERARVAHDSDVFAALQREYEDVQQRARRAELAAVEAAGRASAAAQALATARRADAEYRQRRSAIDAMDLELRHHNELDDAFTRLRGELNARVRPELGELASAFLTDVTEGRYTQLEIDEAYNIVVLDEGEEKPVISGGEEDVANLVLRLAISQMIAERAGHPLSLLILDEVFGSLDVERRDRVVQLLHRLEDRFDQVILITHIETVREGLDRVIRVGFDERSGASVVSEEVLAGAA